MVLRRFLICNDIASLSSSNQLFNKHSCQLNFRWARERITRTLSYFYCTQRVFVFVNGPLTANRSRKERTIPQHFLISLLSIPLSRSRNVMIYGFPKKLCSYFQGAQLEFRDPKVRAWEPTITYLDIQYPNTYLIMSKLNTVNSYY